MIPAPFRSEGRGGSLKLHRGATFGEVSNILPGRISPQQTAISQDWHDPCHITRARLGVAALFACSTGRGGARNRADRVSHDLTAAQVRNLMDAADHANLIGLPLTRMFTIHWEAAGVPLSAMARATGRFLDMLAKALARQGHKTSWLWTHENGDGKGGHCHLLAHVPADLAPMVAKLQRGWLKRITGQPYRRRVIYTRPIGGRLGLECSNPELHAVNLDTALAYVLKGANADASVQFDLARLEPGGAIIGKRCGTSQNIAAKARSALWTN